MTDHHLRSSRAAHYRREAERVRIVAAKATDRRLRDILSGIATQYETLAGIIERSHPPEPGALYPRPQTAAG